MAKLRRSGDYWRVGDLRGKLGKFASEPFLQKNPKGDEIYYIQVTLDDTTKLWGMSWAAFNGLIDILGDEGLRWINAEVKFENKLVKTTQGMREALVANPISGQGGKAVNEISDGSQAQSPVSPFKEVKVPTQSKTDETQPVYGCPSGCGFRTNSVKDLGAHVADCKQIQEMPSTRAQQG